MTSTRTMSMPVESMRGRTPSTQSSAALGEYIPAWQCIGCGKIEAPQTCIGVCRDKKVFLVGKNDYDAALAEILRLQAQLEEAASLLLRFERATPHADQWERSYRALQEQVREVRALLMAPAPSGA